MKQKAERTHPLQPAPRSTSKQLYIIWHNFEVYERSIKVLQFNLYVPHALCRDMLRLYKNMCLWERNTKREYNLTEIYLSTFVSGRFYFKFKGCINKNLLGYPELPFIIIIL